MRREPSPVRSNFFEWAAEFGFDFVDADGEPCWDESIRYVFSLDEIEENLESATQDLHALCLELVDKTVRSEALLKRLRIPIHAWDAIAASWTRRDPSLYGRFDLAYDGKGPAKLLEYNADTPTSLVEAAVAQWHWLEQLMASGALPKNVDQFNSLHEKLVTRWREIGAGRFLHLACMSDSPEDLTTVSYLDECARGAGLSTKLLDISGVGLLRERSFVDPDGKSIDLLFRLYPWEWMFADTFGHAPALQRIRFVEPPWKMILSNKAMLALLWEMEPGHPNLLPCFLEEEPAAAMLGDHYARKPVYSREGADIELVRGNDSLAGEKSGYGREGFVRQALCPLPEFAGRFPVLGCWLVGDDPAGLGVREDNSPITSNRARFVPHIIV